MGIVYLVRDNQSGVELALKTCEELDDVAQRRFAREVRIMAGIQHANVMPVLDSELDYVPPFFVMPLGGGSLQQELHGGMAEATALAAFREVCQGVQAIHAAGCTHRDIKPLNVMRLSDERLVVSDMGLAKFETRDSTILTQTVQFLGTQAYCAPEQFTGSRDADIRTDVFQLGKTLYQLLTGDLPVYLDREKLSAGLFLIVDRATQTDSRARYQSVGALWDSVQAYLAAQNPDASPSEAFEAVLNEAKLLRDKGEYSTGNVQGLLTHLLRFADEPQTLIEQFHRIPRELYELAIQAAPAETEAVVREYSNAIRDHVAGFPFEFAEHVARQMQPFFASDVPPTIKALALRAVLSAAVTKNRYAAMDRFDAVLVKCRGDDAVAVAAMLEAEFEDYRKLADRVARANLDPAIRPIYDRARRE